VTLSNSDGEHDGVAPCDANGSLLEGDGVCIAEATRDDRRMASDWPHGKQFWKDKRVCVTGGAGFLGSYVVEKLVDEWKTRLICAYT
jgi:hypothetical protein